MSARDRAVEIFSSLQVRWESSSEVIGLVLAVLEEVEHQRPVVEIAKLIIDAKSGDQRAKALDALSCAIANLRASGR